MDLKLADFLRSGSLGGLMCGASAADVLRCFGSPEEQQDRRNEEKVLFYGPLQMWIRNDRVESIGIYLIPRYLFPSSIRWVDWRPDYDITLAELGKFLQQAAIEFKEAAEGRHTFLRTAAGVYVFHGNGLTSIVCPRVGSEMERRVLANVPLEFALEIAKMNMG